LKHLQADTEYGKIVLAILGFLSVPYGSCGVKVSQNSSVKYATITKAAFGI
jgi:hypothetical protein